jgi:hypothetical protein
MPVAIFLETMDSLGSSGLSPGFVVSFCVDTRVFKPVHTQLAHILPVVARRS